MHVMPWTCWRFYFRRRVPRNQVRFDDGVHSGWNLYERLRRRRVHGELRDALSNDGRALLDRLIVARIVVAESSAEG